MAADDDTAEGQPEEDMFPDERAVIAERLDEFEDEDSHLSIEEVAEELGIDIE